MKLVWRGRWKGGEVSIEAETLEELNSLLAKLFLSTGSTDAQTTDRPFPLVPAGLGCSEAVLTLLGSEWGTQEKSMAEIRKALEANGLFFSKGTLSGTLAFLNKKGDINRTKKAGNWVYRIKENALSH